MCVGSLVRERGECQPGRTEVVVDVDDVTHHLGVVSMAVIRPGMQPLATLRSRPAEQCSGILRLWGSTWGQRGNSLHGDRWGRVFGYLQVLFLVPVHVCVCVCVRCGECAS